MEVCPYSITLKAQIMTAADDSLEYLFIVCFFLGGGGGGGLEKMRLDISCESSARQNKA